MIPPLSPVTPTSPQATQKADTRTLSGYLPQEMTLSSHPMLELQEVRASLTTGLLTTLLPQKGKTDPALLTALASCLQPDTHSKIAKTTLPHF